MPTTLLPAPPDFQTFLRPCMQQKFRPLAHFLTNHKTALQSRLQCYSQNTYVDKILALLDHLPSCVDIFYGMNVDKKWKFLDYLPTSYVHTKLFQKREHYSRGTLFIDIMQVPKCEIRNLARAYIWFWIHQLMKSHFQHLHQFDCVTAYFVK